MRRPEREAFPEYAGPMPFLVVPILLENAVNFSRAECEANIISALIRRAPLP